MRGTESMPARDLDVTTDGSSAVEPGPARYIPGVVLPPWPGQGMRRPPLLRSGRAPAAKGTSRHFSYETPRVRLSLRDSGPLKTSRAVPLVCAVPTVATGGTVGTMATPVRHLRIPDDVWLPAQDVAWRRRTSVTAMVTGFLRSEVMTAEILAEPGALEEIRAAEAAVAAGDVVRGAEAVRALRPRPAAAKVVSDERVLPGTAAVMTNLAPG